MQVAPIVLFVYNRPEHTRKVLESLRANYLASESDLIIYSDGPKDERAAGKVQEVRAVIAAVSGFKSVSVVERPANMGLAKSIIDGVTAVVNKYGSIIVMEDDHVTSPYFLTYMNRGLEVYKDDPAVISIHGYMYPVDKALPETFFLKGADCWGWATWKRGWELFEPDGSLLLQELKNRSLLDAFDFDGSYPYSKMLKAQIEGKNNSWAIRWYAAAFLKGKYTLYPGQSLVQNIGLDDSGTHSKAADTHEIALANHPVEINRINPVAEDHDAKETMKKYFVALKKKETPSLIRRIAGIFK